MELKHSVMVGLMGRQADRFHEYQPGRDLPERLRMVQQVEGAEGIEIVYPVDFGNDVEATVQLVKDSGLAVSAVNLNLKSAKKWQNGSFTSADPDLRRDAVNDMKTAMDLAAEFGAGMITCCPLIDGHNYSFQVDYTRQWRWLEESVAEAADHRDDVRISMEYKLNEARNFCILGDMGRTLYLCERLDRDHVGVTMDVGHALMARETPAEVACLARQVGRLFYVHLNDNAREWDWDMLPGSVNVWDLLEMIYYLDRLEWQGWLAYDVLTRTGDPVEQMSATIGIVKSAEALLERVGRQTLRGFIDEGVPARAFGSLWQSLH